MHRIVEEMNPREYRVIRHAASQIAGRKAARHAYNFKIPREKQHRARYSPYKDIADASQQQVAKWMKDDGHQPQVGGGLFSAFTDAAQTIHNEYRNVNNKLDQAGKDITKGVVRDVQHFKDTTGITPLERTLTNMAEVTGTNVDVEADDFLHRIGLRHHKKYEDDKISDDFRDHARLQKDAYLGLNDRKGTDRFEYMNHYSTDKYATYLDKNNEGKVVIAFRGTSPKEALHNNDLVEDINIAAGNVNAISEFDDYRNHVKRMLDEYGDGNVSLSGYSLGGGKAVALTREGDLRNRLGQTFAIAPGITSNDRDLRGKAHDTKINYIYHHNDFVANSLMPHSGSNHTVLYSERNPVKSHMLLDEIINS